MALIWIAIALAFAVAEVGTVSLFAAFLCLGAIGAAAVALIGLGHLYQVLAFAVVSLLGMVLARPWLLRRLSRRASTATVSGAASMIGEIAVVVRPSGATDHMGHVRIWGENWPAATRDASPLEQGAAVQIVDIEGSTLIVEPATGQGAAPADNSPSPASGA